MEIEIVTLVVSPVHRYDGRPADGPKPYDGPETVDEVQVRAHKGLVGDRFFGTRHTFAAVTFLAARLMRAGSMRQSRSTAGKISTESCRSSKPGGR